MVLVNTYTMWTVACLQMTKKHHNGHMIKCDWLDRLSFREIEMINERQKRESNFMYLMIEFPQIVYDNQEYTVVFFEKVAVHFLFFWACEINTV